MKQNIIAAVFFFSIVANIFGLYIIKIQANNNKQLIYDLNVSQTAFKIQSETFKRVSLDNQMLRQANECLIKYSYRDRCITAIKNTPLPPLVKDIK